MIVVTSNKGERVGPADQVKALQRKNRHLTVDQALFALGLPPAAKMPRTFRAAMLRGEMKTPMDRLNLTQQQSPRKRNKLRTETPAVSTVSKVDDGYRNDNFKVEKHAGELAAFLAGNPSPGRYAVSYGSEGGAQKNVTGNIFYNYGDFLYVSSENRRVDIPLNRISLLHLTRLDSKEG